MKYQRLIEKMTKYQDKIYDNIAKSKEKGNVPEELVAASMATDEWLAEAPKKLGENQVPILTPNLDPLLDYSNALGLYREMFDEKIQSEIVEFQELVEELYTMVMDPIQDPGL